MVMYNELAIIKLTDGVGGSGESALNGGSALSNNLMSMGGMNASGGGVIVSGDGRPPPPPHSSLLHMAGNFQFVLLRSNFSMLFVN